MASSSRLDSLGHKMAAKSAGSGSNATARLVWRPARQSTSESAGEQLMSRHRESWRAATTGLRLLLLLLTADEMRYGAMAAGREREREQNELCRAIKTGAAVDGDGDDDDDYEDDWRQ